MHAHVEAWVSTADHIPAKLQSTNIAFDRCDEEDLKPDESEVRASVISARDALERLEQNDPTGVEMGDRVVAVENYLSTYRGEVAKEADSDYNIPSAGYILAAYTEIRET